MFIDKQKYYRPQTADYHPQYTPCYNQYSRTSLRQSAPREDNEPSHISSFALPALARPFSPRITTQDHSVPLELGAGCLGEKEERSAGGGGMSKGEKGRRERGTYIRPDLGQNNVDQATHNIIPPNLVKRSKRFRQRQRSNTFQYIPVVLLIRSCTPRHDLWTYRGSNDCFLDYLQHIKMSVSPSQLQKGLAY